MTNIEKKTGNQALYSHYDNLYRTLEDPIINMKTYGNIKDVEFFFEMNQIDKQIMGMKIEQERKDSQLLQQRIAIITVSIAPLTIALFFIITYRQVAI